MLDEYKLKGATKKIDIEIETEIAEKLTLMEQHSKLNRSEIVNTALKRFISHHKDFLPADSSKGKS
jgi:metal-responsive CopG/Arc/MetJ family transcriptional regulator